MADSPERPGAGTGDGAEDGTASLPTRTFGPPATVVLSSLVTGVVLVVVLEFLVIISFVGQRLWQSPLLGHDPYFTLPFAVWVVVLVAAIVATLRKSTAWLQLDEHGFRLQGLGRRTVAARWDETGRVIAVRSVGRDDEPGPLPDSGDSLYDGVYVLDRDDRRLISVSSRFFGPRAQEMTLRRAREAGVRIDHVDALSTAELVAQVPQALTFADRHPNLILLALALFYTWHNVITFVIWGL
ncbi:hypothetical protein ACXET9_02375 [Brachybacterium sp. DNPG3]